MGNEERKEEEGKKGRDEEIATQRFSRVMTADRGLVCDYCREHQLLPDSVKAEIIDQAPLSVLEIEDAYLSKKSGLPDVAISLTLDAYGFYFHQAIGHSGSFGF